MKLAVLIKDDADAFSFEKASSRSPALSPAGRGISREAPNTRRAASPDSSGKECD